MLNRHNADLAVLWNRECGVVNGNLAEVTHPTFAQEFADNPAAAYVWLEECGDYRTALAFALLHEFENRYEVMSTQTPIAGCDDSRFAFDLYDDLRKAVELLVFPGISTPYGGWVMPIHRTIETKV